MLPSLEGRRFAPSERADEGAAGADTIFEYHEADGVVWARYEGGEVRLGFLVGVRADDRLEFRYSQLNRAGETANGTCSTLISQDGRGGLVLSETWHWESKTGSGTSVLRELK